MEVSSLLRISLLISKDPAPLQTLLRQGPRAVFPFNLLVCTLLLPYQFLFITDPEIILVIYLFTNIYLSNLHASNVSSVYYSCWSHQNHWINRQMNKNVQKEPWGLSVRQPFTQMLALYFSSETLKNLPNIAETPLFHLSNKSYCSLCVKSHINDADLFRVEIPWDLWLIFKWFRFLSPDVYVNTLRTRQYGNS